VRWDELFDDLEAQAAVLERVERASEVADRTRAEVGRLTLVNRLRGAAEGELSVTLFGAGVLSGTLIRVGADWFLLACPSEVLVPLSAVAAVSNLPLGSVSPAAVGAVESRLALASVLRAIAVDRARVTVVLRDGTTIAGTPDRVGSDFFDVASHDADVAPRAAAVTARTTVPYSAIATVVRESPTWG
jgi:hypothetical protein